MCATLWRARVEYLILAEAFSPQPMPEGPMSRATPRSDAGLAYAGSRRFDLVARLHAADGAVTRGKQKLAEVVECKMTTTIRLRRVVRHEGLAPPLSGTVEVANVAPNAAILVRATASAKAAVVQARRTQNRAALRVLEASVRMRPRRARGPASGRARK